MKSLSQLINDMRSARAAMKKLEEDTPRIIGSAAVKVVKNNFKIQGYDSGAGVKTWPKRSPDTNKRYDKRKGVKGSVYQSSNPILKQTGVLYNSVDYKVKGKLIFVGVNEDVVPYAQKMNDGGPGTWGKNKTNTPARQYLPRPNEGPNLKMLRIIKNKINSERDRALAPFKK